jgi:pre-mRNA-processing factor 40
LFNVFNDISALFRDSFLSPLDEGEKKDSRFDTSLEMSDSDRQLYFADFVIELQAAEDDKRRRIRDARRRAEKAQREAYREFLRKLAAEGKILPYARWRSVEELLSADESFKLVQAQDRDSPHGLFEEFMDEWGGAYRRERSFLSRLLHPSNKKEIVVKAGTTYDEFTKLLLDEAAYSPDVYGDARRIINREEPVSSARLYYDELISRASDSNNAKRNAVRRRSTVDSSEDEGEIIEDGELPEGNEVGEPVEPQSTSQNSGNAETKSQDEANGGQDGKAQDTPSESKQGDQTEEQKSTPEEPQAPPDTGEEEEEPALKDASAGTQNGPDGQSAEPAVVSNSEEVTVTEENA